MLINIDGWFGSGKSVLMFLLDGHPDVFCSPVHDYSFCAFLNQSDQHDWVQTKHVEILRKALARTQFFKLEKFFWDKEMTFEFSSNEIMSLPCRYDYYEFDRHFVHSLMDMKTWKIESIVDTLYASLSQKTFRETQERCQSPTRFATAGNPLFFEQYENFPARFPRGKTVMVRRNVENIIATRSNRKARPEDFKTKQFFSDSFEKRIDDGEVEDVLHYYGEYSKLMKKHPDTFYVVEFDDLILDTQNAMDRVAGFLNLKSHPCLTTASFGGVELSYNGKKYIGQENDRIEELLTKDERMIIQDRIDAYKYSNSTGSC